MVRGGGALETAVRLDGFELPTASHFAWPGGAGGRPEPDSLGGDRPGGGRDQRVLGGVRRTGVGAARRRHEEGRHGPHPRPGRRRRPAACSCWPRAGCRAAARRRGRGWRRPAAASSRSRSPTAIRAPHPSYVEVMGNVDVPLSKVHRLHVLGLDSTDRLDVSWSASAKDSMDGDQDAPRGRRQPPQCVDARDRDVRLGQLGLERADAERSRAERDELHQPLARALPAGARRGSPGRGAAGAPAGRRRREAVGRDLRRPGRRLPERVEHRRAGRALVVARPVHRRVGLWRGDVDARPGQRQRRGARRSLRPDLVVVRESAGARRLPPARRGGG